MFAGVSKYRSVFLGRAQLCAQAVENDIPRKCACIIILNHHAYREICYGNFIVTFFFLTPVTEFRKGKKRDDVLVTVFVYYIFVFVRGKADLSNLRSSMRDKD